MRKILIYNSGGGLGDSIQLFTLILSLKNYFKSTEFYYIGAHENHFEKKLKEYNINIKTLDLNLKYFGFRWWHFYFVKKNFLRKNLIKFDLTIDLQSKLRNTIILRQIPHIDFYSSAFNFHFCSKKNKYSHNKNYVDTTIKNLKIFLNADIKTTNYNLSQISEVYKEEAKKLLPDRNYIGFSITQGNNYRKKSWSLDKFIQLAKKISKKNKVPVFFIEKDNINIIDKIKSEVPNSLFPELLSNLSCPALVTCFAKRLETAVTIDNGIMHMMGLANIPMVVLFGPTDSDKFAPKIDNIKILDSKKIYNSDDINSITVEEVEVLI